MNKKLISILVIFCMLLSIQNVVGPATTSAGSSGGSGGGGGGGSKQVDIDRLLKAVEDGKKNKPTEFEKLKTLLWKDPITNESYNNPLVLMYYKGNNTTVSRTEPVEIITVVKNNNLPEMRRMLDLYLEAKEPGSNEYRKVNFLPNKIQANEYSEETNQTQRIWNDIPSFAYLKKIGEVRLRVNASDGVNKWSSATYKGVKPPFYGELVFNVTNSLPRMGDLNITPAGKARYNDPIEYRANIEDNDGDLLNVTLHILDENGNEIKNQTVNIKPGPLSFKANEYGFFNKEDSGKNFSYYYTFSDGMSINNTTVLHGPNLRKSATIWVGKPNVDPEDDNQYWWQSYNFTLEMKNQDPGEAGVTVWLLTNTESHPWKMASESQVVTLNQEPKMVYFSVKQPFDVLDANQTFGFRFKYSETDQHQQDHIDMTWRKPINAKLVRYDFISGLSLGNILALLLLALMVSMLVERRFYR